MISERNCHLTLTYAKYISAIIIIRFRLMRRRCCGDLVAVYGRFLYHLMHICII